MIKKGLIVLFALLLIAQPVEAKTVTRYATKTIKLQERCNDHAKTIEKLRQNDKVILLKKGKRLMKDKCVISGNCPHVRWSAAGGCKC